LGILAIRQLADENLSWYASASWRKPFSFLPLFFWEKKNGVVSFSERKTSAVFY